VRFTNFGSVILRKRMFFGPSWGQTIVTRMEAARKGWDVYKWKSRVDVSSSRGCDLEIFDTAKEIYIFGRDYSTIIIEMRRDSPILVVTVCRKVHFSHVLCWQRGQCVSSILFLLAAEENDMRFDHILWQRSFPCQKHQEDNLLIWDIDA